MTGPLCGTGHTQGYTIEKTLAPPNVASIRKPIDHPSDVCVIDGEVFEVGTHVFQSWLDYFFLDDLINLLPVEC